MKPDQLYDAAIQEYKRALMATYKNPSEYPTSLFYLSVLSTLTGNDKEAFVFNEAYWKYYERRYSNDVLLAKRGINDYLLEMGIKFP